MDHELGALGATIALALLGGCGGGGAARDAAPVAASARVEGPLSAPGDSGAGATSSPAGTRVELAAGAVMTLANGVTLSVESIVVEEIAASPSHPASNPAGSGVTVHVKLAGEALSLILLSPDYTSSPVGWASNLRIELEDADQKRARLLLQQIAERVVATKQLRVQRGERVRLHDSVDFEFLGHSHKIAGPGHEGPLIVNVDYHDGGPRVRSHTVSPPGEITWVWHDLRFSLGAYDYDRFMDLTVERLALEPVSAFNTITPTE